jgi:hypothetical protein
VVANYGKPAAWDSGAITYGTTVNFADFALTVANYGKQAVTSATLSASLVHAPDASSVTSAASGSVLSRSYPVIRPVRSTGASLGGLFHKALKKRK